MIGHEKERRGRRGEKMYNFYIIHMHEGVVLQFWFFFFRVYSIFSCIFCLLSFFLSLFFYFFLFIFSIFCIFSSFSPNKSKTHRRVCLSLCVSISVFLCPSLSVCLMSVCLRILLHGWLFFFSLSSCGKTLSVFNASHIILSHSFNTVVQ